MMGLTHAIFSLLMALLYARYGTRPDLIFITFLMAGTLLPDIDSARSTIGKRAKFISRALEYMAGHRGLLHSLTGWIIFAIPVGMLGTSALVPFTLGYISHLALDSLTPSGVRPFYPLKYRACGSIRTDSLAERLLFLLFLGMAVYLVYF